MCLNVSRRGNQFQHPVFLCVTVEPKNGLCSNICGKKMITEACECCQNQIYRDTNRTCFGMLLCKRLSGVKSLSAQAAYEEESWLLCVPPCPLLPL